MCRPLILLSLVSLLSLPLVRGLSTSFPYGSTRKIRGVSLGGYLVLEPFITPSIFDNTNNSLVIDEFTFGKYVPRAAAKSILFNHWSTFITESDFVNIAKAGLNHVRIPIGYWAYDISAGEPYIQGQAAFLNKAVVWARTHGLKVIIDLHGAPGSQNGYDNSGESLPAPTWHTKSSNIARTSAIIKRLATQFANQTDVVTAIAPLNEPAGYRGAAILSAVKQFWLDSYTNIRFPFGSAKMKTNLLEVIHDAFQPLPQWSGWQAFPKYDGVAMDTHIYQMFSNFGVQQSNSGQIRNACGQRAKLAAFKTLWVIVGEWNAGAYDCAKYLNGRHVGARYDGTFPGSSRVGNCSAVTGDSSKFSPALKAQMRKLWEVQATAFEAGGIGWIYWTWKTESADEWSYSKGLAGGWIPMNPTERLYSGLCDKLVDNV